MVYASVGIEGRYGLPRKDIVCLPYLSGGFLCGNRCFVGFCGWCLRKRGNRLVFGIGLTLTFVAI